MSVKSELKKFDNYNKLLEFSKQILSKSDKVLLLGSDKFKKDILGKRKELKLTNGKYSICLCEEEYIKELTKYSKKIKNNIYVLQNKEEQTLILEYKYPSMNDDIQEENEDINIHNNNYGNKCEKCKCDKCNQEDNFENQLDDFIEEYSEVIKANPNNIKDILYEFYVECFSAGHLQAKIDVFTYLNNDIQNEVDEINNGYYDEGEE